jgi:hypothetical protein
MVPHRLEFEQEFLEPQLVDLMDNDEQQLVMRGWITERTLRVEYVLEAQVAAIGEATALLSEPPVARLLVQSRTSLGLSPTSRR